MCCFHLLDVAIRRIDVPVVDDVVASDDKPRVVVSRGLNAFSLSFGRDRAEIEDEEQRMNGMWFAVRLVCKVWLLTNG